MECFNNLCWPLFTTGLFCCFDGDCTNLPNSLRNKTKNPCKLQSGDKICVTIHLAENLVKVESLTS